MVVRYSARCYILSDVITHKSHYAPRSHSAANAARRVYRRPVGYASSAAIIWQAAASAGANADQIAGWMTALGLGMGISTLALTLWRKVPILTAGQPRRRATGQRLTGRDAEPAVGVFIFANGLMVLCGLTGLLPG